MRQPVPTLEMLNFVGAVKIVAAVPLSKKA